MFSFDNLPPGTDPELNEAIKAIFDTAGFEITDNEELKQIEIAIRQKLTRIILNAKFQARQNSLPSEPVTTDLNLRDLKQALQDENKEDEIIKIDRPDFILQQSQVKNQTKRSQKPK